MAFDYCPVGARFAIVAYGEHAQVVCYASSEDEAQRFLKEGRK